MPNKGLTIQRTLSDLQNLNNWKYYFSKDNFIAVDIGVHSIKIMHVKRSGTVYSIEKVFKIEDIQKYIKRREIQNIGAIVDSIAQFLKVEKIKTKDIRLLYTSPKSQSKIVELPPVNEKELKSFVEIEFQKQFPNNNKISDVFDYMQVGELHKEDGSKMMILMAITPSGEATSIIKEFQKNKLHVSVLDVDTHALSAVGFAYPTEAIDKAVLDLGYDASKIVFLHENTIVFSRQLPYGLEDIEKALTDGEEIPARDVSSTLQEIGLYAEKDFYTKSNILISKTHYNELIEDSFTNILSEVYRSFQFISTNFDVNISHLILSGGMSNLRHIDTLAAKTMEIKVSRWKLNPKEVVSLPNGCEIHNNSGLTIGSEYAKVFGIAIRRGYMSKRKLVNLIPEAILNERFNHKIKKAVLYFMLIPVGLYGYSQYSTSVIEEEIQDLHIKITEANNIEAQITNQERKLFNDMRIVSGLSKEGFPLHKFLLYTGTNIPDDMRIFAIVSDNFINHISPEEEEKEQPVVEETEDTEENAENTEETTTDEEKVELTDEEEAEFEEFSKNLNEQMKQNGEETNVEDGLDWMEEETDIFSSHKLLYIRGAAISVNSIGTFMQSLETRDYIQSVELQDIQNYYNGAHSYKFFELIIQLR